MPAARRSRAGCASSSKSYRDDTASIRAFGLDVVTALCDKLLAAGAPGLHFYTLNQAGPTMHDLAAPWFVKGEAKLADPKMKSALIAGATGLIGGHVLRRLLAHPWYSRVEVLVRRELPIRDPKFTQRIVDFEQLEAGVPGIAPDEVFCCLGTTIRKAGSEEAFRRVDYDYPLALARLAQAAGAGKFMMVSALGADPKSSMFYSRVKGEVEQAVAAIGSPAASLLRPSLLLGSRAENRPAEKIGTAVGKAIAALDDWRMCASTGRSMPTPLPRRWYTWPITTFPPV